jgi:hypothetical protein
MNYDKETLNRETLFNSRKNFGMLSNIQWRVTDISGNNLTVHVSSSRTDLDTSVIGINIIKSIHGKLPDVKVDLHWIEWKSEHGKGVLISNNGKSNEEITKELLHKLNN